MWETITCADHLIDIGGDTFIALSQIAAVVPGYRGVQWTVAPAPYDEPKATVVLKNGGCIPAYDPADVVMDNIHCALKEGEAK